MQIDRSNQSRTKADQALAAELLHNERGGDRLGCFSRHTYTRHMSARVILELVGLAVVSLVIASALRELLRFDRLLIHLLATTALFGPISAVLGLYDRFHANPWWSLLPVTLGAFIAAGMGRLGMFGSGHEREQRRLEKRRQRLVAAFPREQMEFFAGLLEYADYDGQPLSRVEMGFLVEMGEDRRYKLLTQLSEVRWEERLALLHTLLDNGIRTQDGDRQLPLV